MNNTAKQLVECLEQESAAKAINAIVDFYHNAVITAINHDTPVSVENILVSAVEHSVRCEYLNESDGESIIARVLKISEKQKESQ